MLHLTILYILLGLSLVSLILIINKFLTLSANFNDYVEETDEVIENILADFEMTYQNLKTIDTNGAFEADDETGIIFQNIKEEIQDLKDYLEIVKNRYEEKEPE